MCNTHSSFKMKMEQHQDIKEGKEIPQNWKCWNSWKHLYFCGWRDWPFVMFYYCIVFAIVIQSNFVVVPSPKSMVWLGHLSQIIEWLGHLIVPNKSIFFWGGGCFPPFTHQYKSCRRESWLPGEGKVLERNFYPFLARRHLVATRPGLNWKKLQFSDIFIFLLRRPLWNIGKNHISCQKNWQSKAEKITNMYK